MGLGPIERETDREREREKERGRERGREREVVKYKHPNETMWYSTSGARSHPHCFYTAAPVASAQVQGNIDFTPTAGPSHQLPIT